jgi:sugar-specific transcriptional regulator TrmB
MADLVELLQQLGFSEYEARAYISLIENHPVNGYALAKTSGIPRANIYSVLQKLEGRGAIIPLEVEGGNVYNPVPPGDLLRGLSNRYSNILVTTQQLLERIAAPTDEQVVQNIQGYIPFLDHARDLINRATEQLILAVWKPEAELLAPSLAAAEERGVNMTVLCLQACGETCGNCAGHIYRYHVTSNEAAHWLIVIRDDSEMLMGTADQQAAAIRTHNPNLIEMTDGYIRHSITLAAVLSDMGLELEQRLTPQSRFVLSTIGRGNSWLQQLHTLLKTPPIA